MNAVIVATGVADTSAAHVHARAANGTTHDLTIVWSTRQRRCEPTDMIGEHAAVGFAADVAPNIWDPSGCGNWWIATCGQCPVDGTILQPRAVLRPGWLRGAALGSVARMVARWAAEDDADDRRAVHDWLEREVAEVAAGIRAGDLELEDLRDADQTDPGEVGVENGQLVAWAPDPANVGVVVVSRPLERVEHDLELERAEVERAEVERAEVERAEVERVEHDLELERAEVELEGTGGVRDERP